MRYLKLAAIFLLCVAVITAGAQKPAEPVKLSPAASAEYLKIDAQQAELVRAYNELAERKRLLTIDVPAGWVPKPDGKGVVVFSPPEPPKEKHGTP